MRSPLIQIQTIEYRDNEPFILSKALKSGVNHTYQKNSHWHEDMQLIYLFQGRATVFMDGESINVKPGQLVVINCESVHRVILETEAISDPTSIAALDLMIPRNFLDQHFPEHKVLRFTNKETEADGQIREIMMKFTTHLPEVSRLHDRLYLHGLLLQLLYHLCEQGVVLRADEGTRHEGPGRLKSILNYINEHFREPLTQADIAARFFLTPQYFSRYFKQRTGVTFSEHLTGRRIHGARQDLMHTDKLITEIALYNGFPDERSFINEFKKMYQVTPLQYRKTLLKNLKTVP